ncbi:MAG: trigger factor [Deltaproteobacteria bacterium]|nr:trigger factor [Deltaproteobacteria bacterium]
MQVTVEDITVVKKKLCVEIPHEDVLSALDKAYAELKKKANVKGFRKGKAPRSVLERHFKKDVHEDVTSKLITDSYPKAIEESGLQVIETSDIDNPELDTESAFTFKATVELKPELPEVEFSGLELKKTVYKVSDEEISKQIAMLRKHFAKYVPIEEDRAAEIGDFLSIDYVAFEDGVPSGTVEPVTDLSIKLGESGFSDAFDQAIEGMNAGEEKKVAIDFAEDFNKPDLAGKKIEFTVTLKEIRQEELPPVDDDLAKKMGKFETLAALEDKIRESLQDEYDKRMDQELQEQIFDFLIKEEFEVPEVLINLEIEEIVRDSEMYFANNGLSMDQLGLTREAMAEKYRPMAEKQARRHLLLGKIIDQENLDTSEEEVDAEMEKLAAAMNHPLEQVQSYYKQNPGKIDGFKHAMLEKRAINLIVDKAVITEAPPAKEGPETAPETADDTA